jgi:hypothetical protein
MYCIVKSNTDIRMDEYLSIRIFYAGPIRIWIIEYSNTRIIPITNSYYTHLLAYEQFIFLSIHI